MLLQGPALGELGLAEEAEELVLDGLEAVCCSESEVKAL